MLLVWDKLTHHLLVVRNSFVVMPCFSLETFNFYRFFTVDQWLLRWNLRGENGLDGEMASGDWLPVLGKSTPLGFVVSMIAMDLYQRPAYVLRDNDMISGPELDSELDCDTGRRRRH